MIQECLRRTYAAKDRWHIADCNPPAPQDPVIKEVLNIQDCSRQGTYHNKQFKATAESVGLIVTKSEKYGYAHTAPSDSLIEWILENDIQEIKLNRNEGGIRITGGNNTGNASGGQTPGKNPNSHSTKYTCPVCGNSVRATKKLNVICGDCMQAMLEI